MSYFFINFKSELFSLEETLNIESPSLILSILILNTFCEKSEKLKKKAKKIRTLFIIIIDFVLTKLIIKNHKGKVPENFEDLEKLPGVGHKTASVVMSQGFGHSAFPVDTHIHRLAQRWGLTNGKNVIHTENDLNYSMEVGLPF